MEYIIILLWALGAEMAAGFLGAMGTNELPLGKEVTLGEVCGVLFWPVMVITILIVSILDFLGDKLSRIFTL